MYLSPPSHRYPLPQHTLVSDLNIWFLPGDFSLPHPEGRTGGGRGGGARPLKLPPPPPAGFGAKSYPSTAYEGSLIHPVGPKSTLSIDRS